MAHPPAERVDEMLHVFPDIVELYPLDHFLDAVLVTAERVTGRSPLACFVAKNRRLAVRRDGQFRADAVTEEVGAAVLEGQRTGVLAPRVLGGRAVARALQDLREMQVVPCSILSRPVGHLLLPLNARHGPDVGLLVQLVGYYLHRDEIERDIQPLGGPWAIMGCSPWIFRAQEDLERFARLREPVLITGESGSGKEVFAQAVHVLSPRRGGPFVSVNCAAAPSENMLLDEFFGHRRGAFSGAVLDKEGCCQQAHGGTLFLDEIGEMSHELQTLLLRTIGTGEVRRLGDERLSRVDVRLVSATHKDLLKASHDRSFRADLFYRISAFQIHIPPLRERVADIRYLAEFTLHCFAHANGLPPKRLTEAALRRLEGYPWPGNVRELENVLKRAFVLATGESIDSEQLRFDGGDWVPGTTTDRLVFEMRHLGGTFWDVVYGPFMHREITHSEVAMLLEKSLPLCGGQLKRLGSYFNVGPGDYGRFVAFLHRHGFRPRHGPADGERP